VERLSVTAAITHWSHNFMATDNLEVAPADTVRLRQGAIDPLPGGGGYQVAVSTSRPAKSEGSIPHTDASQFGTRNRHDFFAIN